MIQLTVGYVSGIIAAAVFLTQLFIPTAICLLLVGILNEQHSAVTWSVVSRILHSSYWPVWLAADTAAGTGVSRRVRWIAWLQPIVLGLVAVASVVTPLGLYDQIAPNDDTDLVKFQYVPDISPIGKATTKRSSVRGLRMCYETFDACPGAPPRAELEGMDDLAEVYQVWPSSVDLFTSGKQEPTVSSMFDIEWRSYFISKTISELYGEYSNTSFAKGYYRFMKNFILDEKVEAIDGLIVDSMMGRVGFRNHTIPVDVGLGTQWTEDILFVEPESRCVNTNITFDYVLKGGNFDSLFNITLVDHGGFVNIEHQEPTVKSQDFQADPGLYDRAYSLAWHNNLLLMQFFNITPRGPGASAPFSYINSHLGKVYNAQNYSDIMMIPNTLQTSRPSGDPIHKYLLYDSSINSSSSNSNSTDQLNPWKVTLIDFLNLGETACMNPINSSLANYSNVATACGFVYGAHVRTDGGDSRTPDENSTWSIPIYSCASATRAAVRRVTFRVNGTATLDNLAIDSIGDGASNKIDDIPLWGVENLANFTLAQVAPLWGIVSPKVGAREDISTIQREYLWIPGYPLDRDFGGPAALFGDTTIPGNYQFWNALATIYVINDMNSDPQSLDYTGSSNLALYEKWRSLSGNATGTEQVLNLIYTDLVANSMVGTKSWLSDDKPFTFNWSRATADVSVTKWSRKIKYHIAYAIPAALCLLFTMVIGSLALALLLLGRTGTGKLKVYLAQTSAGRILGTFLYPGMSDPLAPRKTWIQEVGVQPVNLMREKTKMMPTVALGSGPMYTNVPATEDVRDVGYKDAGTYS